DEHPGVPLVSAAAHMMVLGSVVGALLFGAADTLPEVPTIIAFVADMPVPAPPPPPPAAPRVRQERQPQPTSSASASGPTFTAPAEIPLGIEPERAVDLGDEGGVAGGVPGGIPGGVLGGPPGGIVTEELPPP